MPSMQIELDEKAAEQIRQLALILHRTPEQTAEDAVAKGLHILRRFAFYRTNVDTADVAKAQEILRNAGKGNPPMPGDELPEDLKYLLDR